MYSDEILEEVWKVKEELAREAGYDLDKHIENIRKVSEAIRPDGMTVISSLEELQELKRQRKAEYAANPPKKFGPLFVDPIVEEVHRIREDIARQRGESAVGESSPDYGDDEQT